ncbi:MAG: exosortase/archaeosortase family protein [Deltaproteobacteria bacterium]|jgi:exosortase A
MSTTGIMPRIRLQDGILLTILVGAFLLVYSPVVKALVSAWADSDQYSHGFLIGPIGAYIIYSKRKRLENTPVCPSQWGLFLVTLSLLVYAFSFYADIRTLSAYSIIPLIAGIILYLWGLQLLKEMSFPLFILIFMIPFPSQLYSEMTIPLQLFVTKVSVWMAYLFGVPVYREGNIINLPAARFQVVQTCSGLRSVISLLTVGAVLSYFFLHSKYTRVILFLSAIPVAILVNIIRVTVLVLIFYYLGYDLSAGESHTILGLGVFLIAMASLVIIQRLLSQWDRSAGVES